MTSLESMKNKLERTGLYDIGIDSNIYIELSAYAAGLDIIGAELETMERELFVATAEGYGLERYERLWGAVRDDMPACIRRDMIVGRSTLNPNDFTLQGMERILGSLGVAGRITEHPTQMRMEVDLTENDFTKGQRNFVINQIRELFPTHLDIDIVLGGLSWAYIETLGMSFADMEGRGLSWTEIDYLIGDNDNVIV